MRTILALLFAVTLSAETMSPGVERFQLPGRGAHTLAVTSDGTTWTTADDDVAGDFHPAVFRLSPDGVLTKVLAKAPAFDGPLAANEEAVWMANRSGVARFDVRTGELTYTTLGFDVENVAIAGDGTVWVNVLQGGRSVLTRLTASGIVADAVALPAGTFDMQADADGGVWCIAAGALHHVSRTGVIARIDVPFAPLHVEPMADSLWVTTRDRRIARIAFDGTILAIYPTNVDIYDAAVDASGALWFADEANGIRRLGRDGVLHSHELPRLPETECPQFSHSMPIAISPGGTLVLFAGYDDDGTIFFTPCDDVMPADFLYRVDIRKLRPYRVDDLNPATRKRAVRK